MLCQNVIIFGGLIVILKQAAPPSSLSPDHVWTPPKPRARPRSSCALGSGSCFARRAPAGRPGVPSSSPFSPPMKGPPPSHRALGWDGPNLPSCTSD